MSDLIRKDDVIKAIKPIVATLPLGYHSEFASAINSIPTAEPKVGRWIDTGENLHKCSNCGQIIFSQTPYDLEMFHAYCGRCGAKMERRSDEHNT